MSSTVEYTSEELAPTSESCLDVSILPNSVRVDLGGGTYKYISIDDFMKILSTASSKVRKDVVVGYQLPTNVFFLASSGSNLYISCYYPSGVKSLKYQRVSNEPVLDRPSVMPNIIVSHTINIESDKLKVQSSQYFCTDLPVGSLPGEFITRPKPESRVFLLPFTNTYSSAQMCYGQNSMPTTFTNGVLKGLHWYYQYLFESPFNNDLGLNAVDRDKFSGPPREWYELLATKAESGEGFPYDMLREFTPLP